MWYAILATALVLGTAGCDGAEPPTTPAPPCVYTLSPGSASYGPDGGNGTVTIAVSPGCAWTITGAPDWIRMTSAVAGTGPATAAYVVEANPGTSTRASSLTIGGQAHTISQDGRPAVVCTYDLAPAGAQFSKDAASGGFAVSAPAGCSWSAVSDAAWVTVTTGQQGNGNGSVSFTVSRNLDVADRQATITVAGRAFAIQQAGDVGGCQYSVAPVNLATCMPAGSLTVTVTTQANCPWTATPDASWLGVGAATSGRGSATVSVTFSENYDAPRNGVVMVRWPTPTAGQNIHLAQAGCLYAVSRRSFSITAAGGSGSFDVFQQAEPNSCGGATQDRCVWTAASDASWVTVTGGMPRAGDGPVAFSVAANDGPAARVGRITVRDQAVTITQAGR